MKTDSYILSLCPHCNEKGEFSKLEKIVDKISEILSSNISLRVEDNFIYENKVDDTIQIYYANPDQAIKLLEKGYIPLAKLKNTKEFICSIKSKNYNPSKESTTVALINSRFFFLPLLFYRKEFKKFNILLFQSYEEVIKAVRENKADIGFIFEKLLDNFKDEESFEISYEFCFPVQHYIFIHPELSHLKEKILLIDEFEKVSPEEIERLKMLFSQLDGLLKEWAYNDIAEAILSSPNFGIVIYHEKISFFNEYTKILLGYSDEELYKMSSIDLVFPEDRQKVMRNRERRLRGEKFSEIYDIRFLRKDGSIVFVECISNTILFKGLYSGFLVFYDITERKYNEKAREILMEINNIITQSLTEEDIYVRVCKSLVEKFNFALAWVAILDYENQKIIPKYFAGDDRGLFDIYDFRLADTETLTNKSIANGEIIINPDSRDYAKKVSCAQELVKRNFMSSCTIPIFKSGKVTSLLKIYSQHPKFFNEITLDIFKEIQKDISFAIDRVERIRHSTIISEAIKNSDTWILITDERGRILYVNEAVERISGYKKEELIGENPRIFKSGLNPPEFYEKMWETILSGKTFEAITPNRKKSGEIFHADLKIIPVKLPGNLLRFVAVARDITRELNLSESLIRLQQNDALTDLLNFNGFYEKVSKKLSEIKGFGMLVLIDIYEMTQINKIYGINRGDKFLKEFAANLKKAFPDTNCIARLAADTFGVFIEAELLEDVYRNYAKIYELIDIIYEIENERISATINAAIALFPKDGQDFKSLYERADITLQKCRKKGPGVIQFFDPQMEKEVENRWEIYNLIKKAVENSLFVFYYQPYFYTNSLKLAGCEALVRIIDKSGKIYTPNLFIDDLENSFYLEKFERWAIKEIVEKIENWGINISLNISGKTFVKPVFQTILTMIPDKIREKLTIEITERIFIDNSEIVKETLKNIKTIESPPKIAMDDFGTGYSSISYLKDLPIDIVKIDRTFIKDMTEDKNSLAIVQTIIELARRLDKKALAEGVETEKQFELLKEFGCDLVQGFLFAKPIPEEELLKMIKSSSAT